MPEAGAGRAALKVLAAWGLRLLLWQAAFLVPLSARAHPALLTALALALLAGFARVYLWPADAAARAREHARVGLRRLDPACYPWMALATVGATGSALALAMLSSAIGLPSLEADPSLLRLDLPTLLVVAVAVPLIEEWAFRGHIQGALTRVAGTRRAVLLTSALFSAIHFDLAGFAGRFALGLAFSGALLATRSIWAPILMHMANNALAMLAAGMPGDAPEPGPGATLAFGLGLAVFMVPLTIVSLRRLAVISGVHESFTMRS